MSKASEITEKYKIEEVLPKDRIDDPQLKAMIKNLRKSVNSVGDYAQSKKYTEIVKLATEASKIVNELSDFIK